MAQVTKAANQTDRTGKALVPDRIYFDMDGVLADFDRGVAELAHFEKRSVQGESSAADDLMWEAIQQVEHFYDKLDPIVGSIELFCDLHARYGDRCEILTGIPKPKRNMPTSGDDKTSWVRRLLPDGVKVNVVYRQEKRGYCTGAGSILIDDFSVNVADWEACGGTGILFTGADEAREALRSLGVL